MNDIKKRKNVSIQSVTDEMLLSYMETFGIAKQLNDNHKKQFMTISKAFGLNPWKREIYPVPYKNKKTGKDDISIITGFEVYLKRADRTGNLNGWGVKTDGKTSDNSLKAIITIYRKDWDNPFIHEVYFAEYNLKWNLWQTKPITMLKKVAMAQGFRLAFPDELGGMPYTADEQWEKEVSNKIIDIEASEEETKKYQEDPPAKSAKKEDDKSDKTLDELKDKFENEMFFHLPNQDAIEDWFSKNSDPKFNIYSVVDIKSPKQLEMFKGKFRKEFGEPQRDLLPEKDIND